MMMIRGQDGRDYRQVSSSETESIQFGFVATTHRQYLRGLYNHFRRELAATPMEKDSRLRALTYLDGAIAEAERGITSEAMR